MKACVLCGVMTFENDKKINVNNKRICNKCVKEIISMALKW